MNLTLEQQRIQRAEIQISELQKDNTRLINETRMLRAQLKAARAVLMTVLIDGPIELLKMQDHAARRYNPAATPPMNRDVTGELHKFNDMRALYERIELLEKDAWTQAGALARDFVKGAEEMLKEDPATVGDFLNFIESWETKFKAVLG